MYCPKCKYTSFDHYEKCPMCATNWTEILKEFNLAWLEPVESVWFKDNQGNMENYTENPVRSAPEEENFLLEFHQDLNAQENESAKSKILTQEVQEQTHQLDHKPDDETQDFDFLNSDPIENMDDSLDMPDYPQQIDENDGQELSFLDNQEDQEDEAPEVSGLEVPGLEEMFSSQEDTKREEFSSAENLDELIADEEGLDLLSEFDPDFFEKDIKTSQESNSGPITNLDEIIIPEEDFNIVNETETKVEENTQTANQDNYLFHEGEEDLDLDSIPEVESEIDQDTPASPDSNEALQQENEQESDMFDLYLGEDDEEDANMGDIEIELDFDEDETDNNPSTENEK